MDVFEFHYFPHDYFFIFGRVGLWIFTIGILQATLVHIIHKRYKRIDRFSRSSKNMFTCFPFAKHISPTPISLMKFSDIKFQFHPSVHSRFFQIFHQPLLRCFYVSFHGVQVQFPSSLTTYWAKPCGWVCSALHAYLGTEGEFVLGFFRCFWVFWFCGEKKYDQKHQNVMFFFSLKLSMCFFSKQFVPPILLRFHGEWRWVGARGATSRGSSLRFKPSNQVIMSWSI